MTISATTQGLRPGVCTSTSRPSTPFTGQLIFETDTNRLAVWNGTSWVFLADADTPSGLQLIKTDTITSGGSKEITGVFSSEFDNYKIIISNVRSSVAAGVSMRMGTLATGSLYRYSSIFSIYGQTTVTASTSNGANEWEIGIVSDASSNSGGFVELQNPNQSQHTKFQSAGSDTRSGGGGMRATSGYLDNTTSYTSFTLLFGSATFTSCDVRVYGYRNS